MRVALVAIMLCLATPAWAALTVYSRVGVWDVFKGTGTDGRQTCGIGNTNPADGRAFSLRFALGDSGITFIADKPGWHSPAGTRIPVVMQIGLDQPWSEPAVGNGERVEWMMATDLAPTFDAQFRRAGSMTVTFPSGSERPWIISLSGSAAASDAMGRCVTAMMQNTGAAPVTQGPTQPYGSAPAPPPTPAPPLVTSPARPVPTAPVQPAAPSGPGQPQH
jgi:hypothetical protein